MKRIAATVLLSAVMAACGQTPTPASPDTTAPPPGSTAPSTPATVGGFPVDGQPDLVPRRVELPASQALPMQAASSRVQSQSLSPWSGPMVFAHEADNISVMNDGSLLVLENLSVAEVSRNPNHPSDGDSFPTIWKFDAQGQQVGPVKAAFPEDQTIGDLSGRAWLVSPFVPEPARANFLFMDDRAYNPRPMVEMYSKDLQLFNESVDPYYRMDLLNGVLLNREVTTLKPGKTGFFIGETDLRYSGTAGNWNSSYNLYQADYQPWGGVEVDQRLTFRPPKAYASNSFTAQVDTSSDGAVYVGTFSSYKTDCIGLCPSVAGISKVVDGDIAWQVFWDNDTPISLDAISANEAGVTLLVTEQSSDQPTAAYEQHLLTFDRYGTPVSDRIIGHESWFSPFLKVRADGRFIAGTSSIQDIDSNMSTVVAGSLEGGITRKLNAPEYTSFTALEARGDYVYLLAKSSSMYGAWLESPLKLAYNPYRKTEFGQSYVSVLLPFDFDLNQRW